MRLTIQDSLITLMLVVVCILGAITIHVSMFYGFVTAIALLLVFFRMKGFSVRNLIQGAMIAVSGCTVVYLVILLMGASIATWIASGVIPAIIYYGLDWFSAETFLVSAFLITAIVSLIMGTGLGTLSTIGIALLGIGSGFGFPPAMILGAILSGSYLSDKLSPVGGLVNLQLGVARLSFKTYAKEAMKTTVPVVLICIVLYSLLGKGAQAESAAGSVEALRAALASKYVMSPLLFAIPAVLMVMTFKGFKVYLGMAVCIVLGGAVALMVQGVAPQELMGYLATGYRIPVAESEALAALLKGGGVVPMLEVVLIVICAVAFSGLLERTGALSPMIRRLIRETDSPVQLTLKTALLSILFLSVSCDQTLAILLPVKSLHKDFERRGLSMAYLVRTISDSGVILAPLQFWNVNTIIIVGLTGMGPGLYAKYSFLIYLFPVVSILYTLLRANKIGHNSKGDQYDTAV